MLGPEQTKHWEEWSVTQHIFPRQQGKERCFPGQVVLGPFHLSAGLSSCGSPAFWVTWVG